LKSAFNFSSTGFSARHGLHQVAQNEIYKILFLKDFMSKGLNCESKKIDSGNKLLFFSEKSQMVLPFIISPY